MTPYSIIFVAVALAVIALAIWAYLSIGGHDAVV